MPATLLLCLLVLLGLLTPPATAQPFNPPLQPTVQVPAQPTGDFTRYTPGQPTPQGTPQGMPQAGTPTAGESAYVTYQPYQIGKELDLWNIEAKRFIRSEPVMAPDRHAYAYTEVIFTPQTRHTTSSLYLVPLDPPQQPPQTLPSEGPPPKPLGALYYQSRVNPDLSHQQRQQLLTVGGNRTVNFEFRTLTIVDWSASGTHLLLKQRSGVLHAGLKTSDILVYDQQNQTMTIYPEIKRAVEYYWMNHGNLPNIESLAWDLYPLGWLSGSDTQVVLQAWVYDKPTAYGAKPNKKFLGLWQYNVADQRTRLLSLENTLPPITPNGQVPNYVPQTNPGSKAANDKTIWQHLRFWQK